MKPKFCQIVVTVKVPERSLSEQEACACAQGFITVKFTENSKVFWSGKRRDLTNNQYAQVLREIESFEKLQVAGTLLDTNFVYSDTPFFTGQKL